MEEELVLKKLLDESLYYLRNSEFSEGYKEKALGILDSIDGSLSSNTRQSLSSLPMEIFVRFVEIALESGLRDGLTKRYVTLTLQHFECKNQFYVRLLLAQALLEGRIGDLKAEKAIEQLKKAWDIIKKAIEICALPTNKPKYQFLVYNASITMWRIIRPYIKNVWGGSLTEILEKLVAIIEEADDVDIDWRCNLLAAQALALTEAGKKPEGLKALDKISDLIKKKSGCSFEEKIIRMRFFLNRDNAGALGNVKKDCDTAESSKEYKSLFVLLQMKCGLIQEANIDKELFALVRGLCPCVVDYAEGKIPEAEVTGQSLSQMAQDRIAEASRIALKYGFIKLCDGCCLALGRAKQSSLRAKIWSEYSKAELNMKRPREEINKKTKMKKTILEKISEDTTLRIDMLKQMERAMVANNRLNDADVILEGCYLIWNNAIPLLKGSTRKHAYKPLLTATNFLEKIQAVNENEMRAAIHLELAKHEIAEDFLSKAELNIKKALLLDYSIPKTAIKIAGHEDDYPGDYQRIYERTLNTLKEQLSLKLNIYKEPEAGMERFILDVENAKNCKDPQLRELLLSRTLSELKDFEYPDLELAKDLVQEEKEEEEKNYKKAARAAQKKVVLLSTEIAKQAFEINTFEMTIDSAKLALQSQWEADKDPQLLLAQAESSLLIAQSSGELLLESNVEICYEDFVLAAIENPEEDEEEPKEFTEDQKNEFYNLKQAVCDNIAKAAQLAQRTNQSWLICNICIYLWNNYLIVFRDNDFVSKIHKGAKEAFKECYQAASKVITTFMFDKDQPDYLTKQKGDILAYVSLYYAKLEAAGGNGAEAIKVCDDLLAKQPPPHLRKHFDALKAIISKAVPSGKAPAKAQPKPAAGKGAKPIKGEPAQKDDQKSVEVISYIELIMNTAEKTQAMDMIKKAIDSMNQWVVDHTEEEDLEIQAELWTKLGQLAYKQNTPALMKTALVCAENAGKVNGEVLQKFKGVPDKRLRWYSLAKCLYGDVLRSLVNPSRQEKESQEQLLLNAVGNFVQGVEIAKEAGLNMLVLEGAKRMWNALLPLLDSRRNKLTLVEPLCKVTSALSSLKENSDPDFLALFYAATFSCITDSKQWKLGEEKVEEAFRYIPQTHHRILWEAKVMYMSKQGKNVFHAVSSMKEATASLQAKVWLKLARSSTNVHNQFSSFRSAIDVLKKDESIEVVEIVIELAEWLLRNDYNRVDIEDELLSAADTLLAIDPRWEEEEDEIEESEFEGSVSRSKRSKSSRRSKASKARESRKGKNKSKASSRSKASKRSMGRSTSKRSATSSKKLSSIFTRKGEEEARPYYLGCSHYDKLFRIYVILAVLAENITKQKEYIQKAISFAIYMWQSSYQIYGIRKFIIEHKTDLQQKHGYKLTSNNNPDAPLDPEVTKQLIADILQPNDIYIQTLENQVPFDEQGWLHYELPEEFITWCKDHQEADVFSYWSFIKPCLSFYYLNKLLELLDAFSMQIQKIPILKTLIAFSQVVAKNQKLIDVYRVQLARETKRLSLTPTLNEDEVKAILDDLSLRDEEKRLEYENIKLQATTTETQLKQSNKKVPEVLEVIITTQKRWMLQAAEQISYGRYVEAKELLDEAIKHCKILNDYKRYAEAMHMIALLFSLSEQASDAVLYHYSCEKSLVTIDLLGKSVCLAARDLRDLHRYTEARGILDSAIAKLSKKDKELVVLSSLLPLHLEMAMLCIIEAKEYLTIPLRLKQLIKNSVKEYKKAQEVINNMGGIYVTDIKTEIEYLAEYYKYIDNVYDKTKREKKIERIINWLWKVEESIIDLKCYKGVDPIAGSKLRFYLDELMDKLNVLSYKIKGQTELLKAPPPPEPAKPPEVEEKQEEPPAKVDPKSKRK